MTAEPTPIETMGFGSVQISGNCRADLAAVGFEPTLDDFEGVTDSLEENICEDPMEKDADELFNSYEARIERYAENSSFGPDAIRVMVEYNCPARSEAVENILTPFDY